MMAKKPAEQVENNKKIRRGKSGDNGGGAVYGFGFIGALVYFIQNADTFWMGVLGLFKALLWPAYIVYKLLESFYG